MEPMSPRVQIDAIVEGMEMQSDDMHSYLHRPSGRVIAVSNEALAAAEDDDEDAVSPEELADAQQVLSAADEYLELPDRPRLVRRARHRTRCREP